MRKDIDILKSIFIIGMVSMIFVISGIVLSAYPQHLYLNNQTVIDASVGNFNNGTANIRGNQVQYSSGDIITLEGRDYIRITGNQVQLGGDTFISGIRTITADINHNILFGQKIGEFTTDSAGRIIIDNILITLVPVTNNILNVRTDDSNYNIEFVNNQVYLTSRNIMLRLAQYNNNIEVYIVGTNKYNNVAFVKI